MVDYQAERYASVYGTNQKSKSVIWELYLPSEVTRHFRPLPNLDHIDFKIGTGPDRGLLDQLHFQGQALGWGKSRLERKLINQLEL